MTLDEMKQRKKELGYTCAKLSKLSGVPLSTVQKIFSGATTSPRYDTMLALENLLVPSSSASARAPEEARSHAPSRNPSAPDGRHSDLPFTNDKIVQAGRIGESNIFYQTKQSNSHTLTDYYQLPDEHRAELIDGVIYDMSSPTCEHQMIAGLIYAQLLAYVRSHNGSCIPMIAPVDVQLDCDEKTMVQPDILVVCDRSKILHRCIYGAPDLAIEILSSSTRKKDVSLKLTKYLNSGVREYWIVDPDQHKVLAYDFSSEIYPVIYGFDAKIPVAIWDGDCTIDFQEIQDSIIL